MGDDRAVRGSNWRVEGVKRGYLERDREIEHDEEEDRAAGKRQREQIEMKRLKIRRVTRGSRRLVKQWVVRCEPQWWYSGRSTAKE